MRRPASVFAIAVSLASSAGAATLPAHQPLDIIVISDEVNPNRLSDAELTQPGDISAALNAPDSGLSLVGSGAQEFDSQCADKALDRLASDTGPHVVIYFAHRAAKSCAGADVQATLTSRIEAMLVRGGGLVVFHHGVYQASGKERVLELIGAQANSISWNTSEGQRVINVAPDHFVTKNGVTYTEKVTLRAFTGVSAGTYEAFVNVPDERYPQTTLGDVAGATRTVLFASNSGGNRVLSFALSKPAWKGRVVTYQPGEYQPNALDDRRGSNFQILANAILFSAGRVDETGRPTDGSSNGGGTGSAGTPAGGTSADAAGGTSGGGTPAGGTAPGGNGSGGAQGGMTPGSGFGGGLAELRGGAASSSGGIASSASGSARGGAEQHGAGGSVDATGGSRAHADGRSSSGCGVVPQRAGSRSGGLLAISFALVALRLRRRRAPRLVSPETLG